ncbi:hypothetical protein [Mycobacterium gastri]|uniref:hypothetical protein n=1 Tax=Mycobacterium gastri TaxID=1777 RepID=UPI00111BE11D|nr:hypothetical protein [Mycobacterium gastri]
MSSSTTIPGVSVVAQDGSAVPDAQLRRSMLATVAHNLAPSGQAIIEWVPPSHMASRPPGWTKTVTSGQAAAR